jgi:hypothetical protein
MLWAPLKLGVLNPAGASVGAAVGAALGDCASTLAKPAPNAISVAVTQEQTRILFERGMCITPYEDKSVARA